MDFDLKDANFADTIAKVRDLQPEVAEDLLKTHKAVLSNEITIGGVAVFIPETSQRDVLDVGYRYYSYNGANMMDQEIFYWSKWSGFQTIVFGRDAGNIASAISSVVIEGATYVPYLGTVLSIINTGSTLASAYQQATGSWPISGGGTDIIQCALTYDSYKKWSYTGAMSWQMGIFTEKARVIMIETEQYYEKSGGRRPKTTTYPNATYITKNFDYPDYQAYIRAGSSPTWENLNYRIPGTNHNVNFG